MSSTNPQKHVKRNEENSLKFLPHQRSSCTNWSSFSSCSVTCGTGFRTRTPHCLNPPNRNCNETNFEVQICHKPRCTNSKHIPTPLRTGPELVEWMGHGFDPYKDKEYNENGTNQCMKGFTLDIFRKKCVDVNECKIRNKCPKGMECVNTHGSYKCVMCPKGFMGINGRCLGKYLLVFKISLG